MVIRDITYLATNTLPVVVLQSAFQLLPLGRYLFTTLNRYQPRDTGNFLFTTASRSVSIVRYGVSPVTILLLDLSRFTESSESVLGKTQLSKSKP